jgi:hypothetical protein
MQLQKVLKLYLFFTGVYQLRHKLSTASKLHRTPIKTSELYQNSLSSSFTTRTSILQKF